eukprot:204730-Pelagomonas_calceolata.AAC.1
MERKRVKEKQLSVCACVCDMVRGRSIKGKITRGRKGRGNVCLVRWEKKKEEEQRLGKRIKE